LICILHIEKLKKWKLGGMHDDWMKDKSVRVNKILIFKKWGMLVNKIVIFKK